MCTYLFTENLENKHVVNRFISILSFANRTVSVVLFSKTAHRRLVTGACYAVRFPDYRQTRSFAAISTAVAIDFGTRVTTRETDARITMCDGDGSAFFYDGSHRKSDPVKISHKSKGCKE